MNNRKSFVLRAKGIGRYLVYADDEYVGYAYTMEKAKEMAGIYAYECANQDIPYFPTMDIIYEFLTEEDDD